MAKQFEADGKWKRVSMSDKCPYMPKNPVAEEAVIYKGTRESLLYKQEVRGARREPYE